jgi:glycerate kinase
MSLVSFTIEQNVDKKEIEVQEYSTISLKLEGNPGTGFGWYLENKDDLLKANIKPLNLNEYQSVEFSKPEDSKLLGQNGCTYVYAKQKGATKENLLTLENNMAHLNDIFRVTFNSDFSQLISSGSGGGIGGAFLGLMKAKLESGSEFFLNNFKVQNLLLNADVIITGEGKVDTQTLEGKGVMSIAYLGGKYLSKKVIVIGGRIDESVKPILKDNGVSSFVEIEKENLSLEELRLVCKDHLLRAFSKIKF